jgi:O-acetyl-ADP-ribose deacetylase (regulator of RNase III)
MNEHHVHGHLVRVVKADLTSLDVDAFVFDAGEDLVLGAGHGGAIAVRGGPAIQAELKTLAPVAVGHAVVSAAGKLKAKHIIHAVGPKFQEEDEEDKLRAAVRSALRLAEEHEVRRLAMPPLGTGFYGMGVDRAAAIIVATLEEHLRGPSHLDEVLICVLDTKDVVPFESRLAVLRA